MMFSLRDVLCAEPVLCNQVLVMEPAFTEKIDTKKELLKDKKEEKKKEFIDLLDEDQVEVKKLNKQLKKSELQIQVDKKIKI